MFIFVQSVFGYTYSSAPAHIRTDCTEHISLLNAADCLYYRFQQREWVRYVWAIGLLAAGQSSTMTVSDNVIDQGFNFGGTLVPFVS